MDVTITVGAAGTGTVLERYDANNSGIIDLEEALDAIDDHFDGILDLEGALDVIDLYFDGLSS